jgi:predicted Zn finger-like uncharacterized protein
MALATRCPNCHALFRVVADQLKLRGGLVRCGACQHVFDAVGTLSYIDDAVLTTTPPASTTATVGAGPLAAGSAAERLPAEATAAPIEARPTLAAAKDAAVGSEPDAAAPVVESMLSTAAATSSAEAGPAAGAINAEAVAGAIEPLGTAEQVAPAFLRHEATPVKRGFSILFGGGAIVLATLALAQLAVLFRADILVKAPQARPALTQLCRLFRCAVNWPARGDLLAVVGSELQALPGTSAFELTAVVRNRGSITLALPAIELTLIDTLNRTVARKVFAPVDYLAGEADPAAHLLAGLEAGADLTIRIAFEARGLNAAGFVVYPFYL